MPKTFSQRSMTFDSEPDDSQLVWLLGDSDCSGVQAVEDGAVLTLRPWLLPMKFIVPWMIFVGTVITCALAFAPMLKNKPADFSVQHFWAFTLLLWLGCIPVTLGFLYVVNNTFAKKGDYCKVDAAARTLELCQHQRTVPASEIIALTVLIRWYRCAGWDRTFQTGVLLRGEVDCFEHYPLVREIWGNVSLSRATQWADRIAAILNVPVRRIELDRQQSKALGDC